MSRRGLPRAPALPSDELALHTHPRRKRRRLMAPQGPRRLRVGEAWSLSAAPGLAAEAFAGCGRRNDRWKDVLRWAAGVYPAGRHCRRTSLRCIPTRAVNGGGSWVRA